MAHLCEDIRHFHSDLWACRRIALLLPKSEKLLFDPAGFYIRAQPKSEYLLEHYEVGIWRMYVSRRFFEVHIWGDRRVMILSTEETEEFCVMHALKYGSNL